MAILYIILKMNKKYDYLWRDQRKLLPHVAGIYISINLSLKDNFHYCLIKPNKNIVKFSQKRFILVEIRINTILKLSFVSRRDPLKRKINHVFVLLQIRAFNSRFLPGYFPFHCHLTLLKFHERKKVRFGTPVRGSRFAVAPSDHEKFKAVIWLVD